MYVRNCYTFFFFRMVRELCTSMSLQSLPIIVSQVAILFSLLDAISPLYFFFFFTSSWLLRNLYPLRDDTVAGCGTMLLASKIRRFRDDIPRGRRVLMQRRINEGAAHAQTHTCAHIYTYSGGLARIHARSGKAKAHTSDKVYCESTSIMQLTARAN